MALVSLPHPPMIGFKENALVVRRFHFNEWDAQAKNLDGSPVNLTGITVIELSVYREREVRGDRVHYVDRRVRLEVGDGITKKTPMTDGWVTISIPRTKTEALDPGLYWYDLWYDDAGKRVLLIDKAEFRIQE